MGSCVPLGLLLRAVTLCDPGAIVEIYSIHSVRFGSRNRSHLPQLQQAPSGPPLLRRPSPLRSISAPPPPPPRAPTNPGVSKIVQTMPHTKASYTPSCTPPLSVLALVSRYMQPWRRAKAAPSSGDTCRVDSAWGGGGGKGRGVGVWVCAGRGGMAQQERWWRVVC